MQQKNKIWIFIFLIIGFKQIFRKFVIVLDI